MQLIKIRAMIFDDEILKLQYAVTTDIKVTGISIFSTVIIKGILPLSYLTTFRHHFDAK